MTTARFAVPTMLGCSGEANTVVSLRNNVSLHYGDVLDYVGRCMVIYLRVGVDGELGY